MVQQKIPVANEKHKIEKKNIAKEMTRQKRTYFCTQYNKHYIKDKSGNQILSACMRYNTIEFKVQINAQMLVVL